MLRPLRKANAETRRVFNKALKTEAHSPLCKLYIYIYIYIYIYVYVCIYIYMLFTGWEVRMVKNCDRGLENTARGRGQHFQDRGQSFSP